MGTLERPFDRGTRLGRAALIRIGVELREARVGRGLSLAFVATAAGISTSQLGRIERGEAPGVGYLTLARCAAVAGMDLSGRLFPGGHPLRDARQIQALAAFRSCLHPDLGWETEVPMPDPRDQRAWDGMIAGPGWRVGVESESVPRDLQAVTRRLQLKIRDSGVDAAILLVPGTRTNRGVLRLEHPALNLVFPVGTREALAALRAGRLPRGNALVVLDLPSLPGRIATGRQRTTGQQPGEPQEGPESGDSSRSGPPGGKKRRA